MSTPTPPKPASTPDAPRDGERAPETPSTPPPSEAPFRQERQSSTRKKVFGSGGGMLIASISLHAILLAFAARWIVQSITAGRALNFKAPQPSGAPAPAQREYRVHPAISSPAAPPASLAPQAITVNSKPGFSLPTPSFSSSSLSPISGASAEMKTLSASAASQWKPGSPAKMSASLKPTTSLGAFSGSAANFGVRPSQGTGVGLVGTLYYMRRGKDGSEIPAYPPDEYLARMVQLFGDGGKIKEAEASKYFRVPQQLTSFLVLFPPISGEIAPAAFGAQQVADSRQCWFVVYQGRISAPNANRYRFVGGGNEVLIVRVDGRVVLDGSWSLAWPQKGATPTGHAPREKLLPVYGDKRAVGDWVKFAASGSPVEVIVGAGWRGAFGADLCVEEEGRTYADSVRPLFKVEGYQKMQAQIDAAFRLPEAAPSFSMEGPTFRVH